MRKLTQQELQDAFLKPGLDAIDLGAYWDIAHYARRNHGVSLREALHTARKRRREVSVFVEKILRTSDLADVVYVIDSLGAETTDGNTEPGECLRLLQTWLARTLMQSVIDKRRRRSERKRRITRDRRATND